MEQPPIKRGGGWEYWTTVSYRSLALVIFAVTVGLLAVLNAVYGNPLASVMARITGGNTSSSSVQHASFARFLNLEGAVRVKKRDSVQWETADYRTELQEGDIVQDRKTSCRERV